MEVILTNIDFVLRQDCHLKRNHSRAFFSDIDNGNWCKKSAWERGYFSDEETYT